MGGNISTMGGNEGQHRHIEVMNVDTSLQILPKSINMNWN